MVVWLKYNFDSQVDAPQPSYLRLNCDIVNKVLIVHRATDYCIHRVIHLAWHTFINSKLDYTGCTFSPRMVEYFGS